jgi:hypothetical protein
MADEWFDLPDGTQVNIPADYTRAQVSTLFDQLSEEFPDSIGRAWSVYGQDKEEEEDEGNIFGALYQAVENLPRGAASVPLMGAQGIAALISPHKDTAIEKKLRGAKDWLFSGVDPKYRDSKIANIGLGVGQMAPLMLGGAGLASLGVGAAVPGMLTRHLGVNMGSKAVQLLGGAKGVQGIAAGSLMSVPMHYGQWASGISDYEQRTGQDVSALKELAGFAPATLLGIGEMLPLSMMPGIGAVAKQSAGLIGAGLAKKGLVSNATAFLTGAATEAVQESASELGQMAMARALYDDEALEEMGSRIWDAGIIGGGAGGIVSVLTNLAIRGAAGGRGPMGLSAAAEDALLRQQKLKNPDPNLAVARAREEGMPVAPNQETLDTNRRKRLSDVLLKEEAERAEQRRYPLAPVEARQQRPDGGVMVTMTPDKFLAANKPLELDEESLETIAKFRSHIEGGGELDPVMLYDEALPNGQLGDGRHRAYAARELGIEEIPVQDFRPQEVTGVLPAYEEFVALTREEFDAKVERKFVEDKAKEAAQDQAAQEARTRAREDSGATFLELDELSDLSAEEILDLFNNEQVTAETYIELLIADRLGNVGRESREELKGFAKVNAEVNNTYTPALVAAAALAGHPRLSIEAETISESLGERGNRAVEILAEYLTPESQALLAQESLSPAEVNTIIDEASSTEGFDKAETDDLIYGFTGNVGLYDRVNQNSQEQAVVWRYDETGQLELVLPNPREEEASVFIREVVAKASGPEGAKGTVDIWKNHSRFESPLLKLLDIKNIELHKDRNTGETGLNSDGFKTLLYRVAGTTDLTGLTPGQRRALFGRIANLPTFSNPTPLPDLSRPLYSAAQVQAVLGELRFARDKATRQGEPWVEVRDLVGSREGDAPAAPKLPTELKNSRAGYGQTVLEFDSDVDRAAYIVRDRTNLSKRDTDFVAWLASQGIDIDTAVAHGNRVKEFIKTSISGQDTFTVPAQADVTPVTADATSGARLTNLLEAKQLVRHLVEAGYVTTQKRKGSKGAMGLQVYLNEVTRPSTVEATDAATDPERAAREAKVVKKSETEKRLASRFQEVRTALIRRLKRYNLPGLEEVLSADLNSIWGAVEGVIESPDNMANSVAMLDGPNAKLWVSLSQIDPDGTRPIKDIIQDVTEEVVHAYDRQGYWFDNELSTMDSRAFDTVVPASVSEQAHKDGLNFVQFAEKLYPDLNQQDLMSEARAKYMTALAKGQLPRGRTAGKVGNLKDKIISFFTAGIESGRDAEMQAMLRIFADFESGEVGRRGTPIPGSPRSLRLSRYADPRHLRELKKAIEAGDKDAEQRIAQDILDEKKFDMAQSAPPELTWRDKLFNQFMMDEELANTKPGEIPPIGLNASERAINEYFRQKRGEQPYTMPEAIKHKFRNQEQWAPSEELESHIGDRVSRTKAEPKLGGEVLLDSMSEMTDALSALHNDEAFDKLTEVQQVNETRRVINGYAKAWSKPWTGLSFKARKDSFWSMLRYNIADGAYPIEKLGQLTDRVRDGIRSLADTSAVSAIRWRNSSGFIMESVLHKGAISWIGTPEDGVHQFIEYTDDQETLIQMMAHLESPTDRKYAAVYSGALRFLDMTRKRLNGEAQAGLDLAEAEGNQANIRYFKKQLEVRPWDVNLSIDEQRASAEKTVALIEAESANVVQFSKSYQAHNKDNLNYLLAKEQITQEMYDYLQDMTYVPLHKDIGMMEAWPLGSSGRGEGSGKSVVVGTMGTADNHVFEHALEDFDGLEDMDLIKNIMSSEMAMIRDTFTNTAARRVVRDTQELTEKGFGAQSRQVDEAGPNVIRIMVKGQEEYHELADPLLANAVMTLGFASTNNFLKVARAGAQVTRWGVVNFPAFIYRNFLKDARSVNSINAAAEGSFFPALNSIKRVVGGGVLQRSRMAGLVSGGGAYVTQQELMSGKGQLQEVLEGDSMIAKGLKAAGFGSTGKRLARQAKMQAQYEKVSADLAEGGMPLKSLSDYYAYIAVSYNNIQQIGESTARLGAYDSVLAATGNRAEAMLAGLETMNYGRRGASPLLNAITSMIPFMAGGITGTDAFIRSWTGSPDTIGKSAVDSRMNDEAAKTIRNRLFIRAMHAVGALFIYHMMVRDEDWYKTAGEVEKMNNFIIPIGDKYIKVPVSFASGALFKAIPESILRMIDEADYTPADVGKEAVDQVKRNLGFHIAPQIMRPMWYAMQNKNDFTREPIVNQYMEGLPEEHQRNDYTSDSAAVLARIFGVLPGVKTLSSPMKMEYLIRSYFGQAGTYAMLAADRVTREVTGKNIVGTRYDWSPLSLLTGEGIENFPIVGDVVGDLRKGRGEVDEFYKLKNEVDIYVSILNKLMREGSPEEVQDWIAKNIDTHNYQGKVRAFGRYNTKWNQRRDRLLESDWMSDDRKRELLFEMIEERDEVLDGLTSVKAGMRGLLPQQEFVR